MAMLNLPVFLFLAATNSSSYGFGKHSHLIIAGVSCVRLLVNQRDQMLLFRFVIRAALAC